MPVKKKPADALSPGVLPLALEGSRPEGPKGERTKTKMSRDEDRRVGGLGQGKLEQMRAELVKQIGVLFDALTSEVSALEALKGKTYETLTLEERLASQRREDDRFTFHLEQRKGQAAFEEKLALREKAFEAERLETEAALAAREAALKDREGELQTLRAEAQAFPKRLEEAAEGAKRQVGAELKREFEQEKKFMVQKYESEAKLLQQQLAALENQRKLQDKEMQALREEKTRAVEQIKELAVAVIRGNEKDVHDSPHAEPPRA